MSPNLAAVFEAAEALPVAERRELIDLLLEGLDTTEEVASDEPPSLSEAWRQEIAKRLAKYDADPSRALTWEQVETHIRRPR